MKIQFSGGKFVYLWTVISSFVVLISLFIACTEDYFVPIPPPQPRVPMELLHLEASYITSPITSVNAKYWKEADYLKIAVEDISTQKLYDEDGLLNMTGTFDGLNTFNEGENPELIMKAAYDSFNLYLMIEWFDSNIDASRSSWFWNGEVDPLKPDSVNGWTSQLNDDKLSLIFEIESASGPLGSFSDVGCAAACHDGRMKPVAGAVDIWNWSLALSAPLGFAFDMHADADNGLVYDTGQVTYSRNIEVVGNNRSGPSYEWNGIAQEIVLINGKTNILDPAYYLINTTPFTGDPSIGDHLYLNKNKGCAPCHGINGQGNGEIDNGPAFTKKRMNRLSRENLINSASSLNHTGYTYFNKLSLSEREHVIAKIRGFAGVPGYYLTIPDQNEMDILCSTNLTLARLEPENDSYKILISRKLDTEKDDDVKFDLAASNSYKFGIALMDNDGRNHIGSLQELLIFLEK